VKEYSAWGSETPDVVSVLLDAQNPRIPELGHQATQREIVAELVHNDAVYELARDIAALAISRRKRSSALRRVRI